VEPVQQLISFFLRRLQAASKAPRARPCALELASLNQTDHKAFFYYYFISICFFLRCSSALFLPFASVFAVVAATFSRAAPRFQVLCFTGFGRDATAGRRRV
jgi:hypothetical protein